MEGLNVCEKAGQCVTVRKTEQTIGGRVRADRRRRSESRPRVGGGQLKRRRRSEDPGRGLDLTRLDLQDAPREGPALFAH